VFLQDFVRSHYIAQWLDPRSISGPFSIDDKNRSDRLHSFCHIHVEFPRRDAETFTVILTNVPWDELVVEIAEELDGRWSDIPTGRCLTLTMTAKNATQLGKLAEAIRKVVGRGRRYLDCNWKWMAPRAANSLNKLADILMSYRRLTRPEQTKR
jgi:hypothetical protein